VADTPAAALHPSVAHRRRPLARATAERSRWAGEGHRLAVIAAGVAVATMPLVRPHGPGNSSAIIDLQILLALVATLLWAAASGRPLHLPYALATAVTVLAGALSSVANDHAQQGLIALFQDAVLLAWAAAIANLARTPAALRLLLVAWAVSAIAAAGFLDVAYLSGHQALAGVAATEGTRAALAFDDPNMAASYFVASLMVILAVKVPRNPLLRALSTLLLLVAILFTGSNGGIATLAVCVAIIFVVAVRRRHGLVPAAGAIVVLLAAGTLVALVFNLAALQLMAQESSIPLVRQSVGRSAQSAHERSLLIGEAAALYQANVLFGIGTNAYKETLAHDQAPYVHEAHDDYVAAIVETGVLGAIGLLLLIGAVGVRTLAVVRGRLKPGFAAVVPSVLPLAAAVAGVAVSAGFYQVLHFRHVWLMFGIVAGLYLWGREKSS
jgi:O-antigen ligase